VLSRSLALLAAGASLLISLTGCSALTRPDEITITKDPIGTQAAAPAAPAALAAGNPAMPGGAPAQPGTG